ncbi:MAG: IclR family transcriptional regulator [Lactobacillus sp.]|jgi:DNA-binding IclR family transcriptional regulator|nr:IclR family transcriptional regulator [Lactobacillus sp.]MCI2033923.1 IclR family transcriptional regulator [Lactobacillus sp.]
MTDDKLYGTALIKGKAILDFILACDHAPTLAEITAGTTASKPTTLKLLTTLAVLQLVRREEDSKRYYLGTQMLSYGEKAADSFDITAIARPYLQQLRDETGETVNLGVVSDGHIVLIEKLETPNSIKLRSVIGGTMHMYSSAMGKAVLAEYQAPLLHQYFANHELKHVTPHTLTTQATLRADLQTVTKSGVGIDDEETEPGVFCIGAVLKRGTHIMGAFSVSSPKYRLTPQRRDDFVQEILRTQKAIESQF